MAIIAGPDEADKQLKEVIKSYLLDNKYDAVDVTKGQEVDFIDTTLTVTKDVQSQEGNLGIVIDVFGAGSLMVATEIKGVIAAGVSDERSGYVTRGHNNPRMITMRSEIVGDILTKNVVKGFVESEYDGDRHQIRVDMLNKTY